MRVEGVGKFCRVCQRTYRRSKNIHKVIEDSVAAQFIAVNHILFVCFLKQVAQVFALLLVAVSA